MIPTTTVLYSPLDGSSDCAFRVYPVLPLFHPLRVSTDGLRDDFMAAMPESGSEDEVLYPYVGAEERFYL